MEPIARFRQACESVEVPVTDEALADGSMRAEVKVGRHLMNGIASVVPHLLVELVLSADLRAVDRGSMRADSLRAFELGRVAVEVACSEP